MNRRKKTIEEVIEKIWAADDKRILSIWLDPKWTRTGKSCLKAIQKAVPFSLRSIMLVINAYEHTMGHNPRTGEFMLDQLDKPRKNRRNK